MWPFNKKLSLLIPDQSPKSLAQISLRYYKEQLETDSNIRQVKLNVISDKLRKYLGESSKIYQSFSDIDISINDGQRLERIKNAAELVGEAIYIIETDGIYEDLNTMLIRENLKESKRKLWYTIGGAIGGALLANGKDILQYLLSLRK